jgi:hypothetical protein
MKCPGYIDAPDESGWGLSAIGDDWVAVGIAKRGCVAEGRALRLSFVVGEGWIVTPGGSPGFGIGE